MDYDFEIKATKNVKEEVIQNVRLLCATRQGSVPHYRAFGLSWSWIDKPVHVAKPLLCAELTEKLEEFEPRATLRNINFSNDPEKRGSVRVSLEIEVKEIP